MTRSDHEIVARRVSPGSAPSGDFTYSIVEMPGIWTGLERRVFKRLRTRLRDGVIGERKHHAIADCCIKDRSETGARLQLDEDRVLPRRFVLTDGADRALYRADLVWQTGREAGVRLVALD